MSYSVTVAIWCDGLPGVLCLESSDWDSRGSTAQETRRNLRAIGWVRRGGRDMCPSCATSSATMNEALGSDRATVHGLGMPDEEGTR